MLDEVVMSVQTRRVTRYNNAQMRPGNLKHRELMMTTMDAIIQQLSAITLWTVNSPAPVSDRTLIKRCLLNILLKNHSADMRFCPPQLLCMFRKHFPEFCGERLDVESLLERSPIRSPHRSPGYQCSPYSPTKSYVHNGNLRIQETDDDEFDNQATAFLQELQNENMYKEFTEFCEKLPSTGSTAKNEPHDPVTNESYQNNMVELACQQWESARCYIQIGGPRIARNSFSSTVSTSSRSSTLSSSPQSPYSSSTCGTTPLSPLSPTGSSDSCDNGVHEITHAWVNASMSSDHSMLPPSPQIAYDNIPITVSAISRRHNSFGSDSSQASDSSIKSDQRSLRYHELRAVRKPHVRSVPIPSAFALESMTPMKQRLNALLPAADKESTWGRIQQLPLQKLASGDSEGDTQLMILLANKVVQQDLYVYHIVERLLKESPSSLVICNRQGKDAIRIAVEDCHKKPLLAAYLAEAHVRGGLPFKVYSDNEETLLHVIVKLGDEYVDVLEQLLSIRSSNCRDDGNYQSNEMAFDVNQQDSTGYTPLHVAMRVHGSNGEISTSAMISALLRAGADILIQEYLNRNTPLHILVKNSANVDVIEKIRSHLEASGAEQLALAADSVNRQNNTILHLACSFNSLPLTQHKMLVKALVSFGGRVHIKNMNGHVPSYLVDPMRKEDMRPILHGKDALTLDMSPMRTTIDISAVDSIIMMPSTYQAVS